MVYNFVNNCKKFVEIIEEPVFFPLGFVLPCSSIDAAKPEY
jgi:hypothetical protein